MDGIGKYLTRAGDEPSAVDFQSRLRLHHVFDDRTSDINDVIRQLEKLFPTLPGVRHLCGWLSGPDFVFSKLIILRGESQFGIFYAIEEEEAIPLCRRLLAYLFRFELCCPKLFEV